MRRLRLSALALVTAAVTHMACSERVPASSSNTTGDEDGNENECEADEECLLGEICSDGDCVVGCRPENDRCPPGTECKDGFCEPVGGSGTGTGTDTTKEPVDPVECPDDMVAVDGIYCVDIYEASRPDATAESGGTETSHAVSQANVIPWMPVTLEEAQDACAAVGKHLCTAAEFQRACDGPDDTTYSYGDAYDPLICNSIDTYCYCDNAACEAIAECPYPHCYDQPPDGQDEPAEGCTSGFHIMPTGSFPDCTNEYGVYDINGNTWELVNDGTGEAMWRGGAYNCIDSEKLHRCDFVARNIVARGFRCCSAGIR